MDLDAAVFSRHGTDLIDFVRSSPAEPYRATNLGTVDTRGVEGSVSLAPAALAQTPLTRFSLTAAFYSADLERLRAEAGATEGRYVLDPLRVKWDLQAEALLPLGIQALRPPLVLRPPVVRGGRPPPSTPASAPASSRETRRDLRRGGQPRGRPLRGGAGVPLPGRTSARAFTSAW
ncbi:MAG: hypothetical protein IPP07_08410 [Holophagales bacterium]|nr:hypothetical protein [Holophagales bacterium]